MDLNQNSGSARMSSPVEISSATAEFKSDIQCYFDGGSTARVQVQGYLPATKVRRLVTHLLSAEPALEIEDLLIRGRSGCSDFVGSVDVRTASGVHVFDFVWDCRWRAES